MFAAVVDFVQDLIAVKQLSLRNADQAEELYTEIELMRQLTHPNIVCYLGAEVRERPIHAVTIRSSTTEYAAAVGVQ